MTLHKKDPITGEWVTVPETLPDLCDMCGTELATATTPDGMKHCRSLHCAVLLVEQGFQLDDAQVYGSWIYTKMAALENLEVEEEFKSSSEPELCLKCGQNAVDYVGDEWCWWCFDEAEFQMTGARKRPTYDYWTGDPSDEDIASVDVSLSELERIPARRGVAA